MPRPRADDPPPPDPFAAVENAFDPSLEPYANMTVGRNREACLELAGTPDHVGYWTAERHLAWKLPPVERFRHDLAIALQIDLGRMEGEGGPLPRLPEGWTDRHRIAVWVFAHRHVEALVAAGAFDAALAPGAFDGWTPGEILKASREAADALGFRLACQIAADPAPVERVQSEPAGARDQSEMERVFGGPPGRAPDGPLVGAPEVAPAASPADPQDRRNGPGSDPGAPGRKNPVPGRAGGSWGVLAPPSSPSDR